MKIKHFGRTKLEDLLPNFKNHGKATALVTRDM